MSNIKKYEEFGLNELSATTITKQEQTAKERFEYHHNNIQKFIKEIQSGTARIKKDQVKRSGDDWTNIGTMAEIASQLNELNNFINGHENEYL